VKLREKRNPIFLQDNGTKHVIKNGQQDAIEESTGEENVVGDAG